MNSNQLLKTIMYLNLCTGPLITVFQSLGIQDDPDIIDYYNNIPEIYNYYKNHIFQEGNGNTNFEACCIFSIISF